MRVGLVLYGSLATLSGGYLYDRKLVEYLRSQGDSLEIVSFPWQSYLAHLLHNVEKPLERDIRSRAVDVWLQDELNHPSLFWMNRRLRRPGFPPLVSIVHHLRSSEAHPPAVRWIYRRVERAYLKTVDGFVFNSQTTRQAVERMLGGARTSLVATPAGDRLGAGLSLPEIECRSARPGALRILFVGNLIRRKGLEPLLRSLARIRAEEWTLRVVGRADVDPGYTREIHALVRSAGLQEQVQFLGELGDPELAKEFAAAQLLAMISSYEGFGIVYLEGMSFGLPALASSAGGARELVLPGETGFLVDPGDLEGAARAIRGYCRDRGLLAAHSLAARRRFERFPGWQDTTARIRDFLVELTAR